MSLFRGTWALLLARRRGILNAGTWPGIGTGLATGFLARLNGAAEDEALKILWVASTLMALIAPYCSGVPDTIGAGQAAVRPRRDELLALPLGKLAIPASVLLAGGAVWLGFVLTYALSFAFAFGPEQLLAGLEHVRLPGGRVEAVPGIPLYVFALSFSFAAIGPHTAAAAALWGLLPWAVVASVPAMGHSRDAATSFALLVGGCTGLYLVVVPFALYLRPAHLWSIARSGPATADGIAFMGTLASVLVLGLAGPGKLLALVVAATVLGVIRARRKAPPVERSHAPLLRTAHVLALTIVGPAVAVGLEADARLVASAADPEGKLVTEYLVSPDGRWLAARVPLSPGGEGVARIVVADLEGREPRRVLDARSAALEPGAWSRDGRFLAVQETCVGRFTGVALHRSPLGQHASGAALASLAKQLHATVILEVATGRLERRPLLELAPGWLSPEELVSLSARRDRAIALADGRGRRAELPPTFRIVGYDDGALVRTRKGDLRLGPEGLVPVEEPGTWSVVTRDHDPAVDADVPSTVTLVLARGAARATVTGIERDLWVGRDSLVARTPGRGLVRIALPGLERTTILPDGSLEDGASSGSRHVRSRLVIRTAEGHSVLDPLTGKIVRVPSDRGFVPEAAIGDRVVGRGPGGQLLVRDLEQGPRAVFATER